MIYQMLMHLGITTGVIFKEQTISSIFDVVRWFEDEEVWKTFNSEIINEHANKFSRKIFENKFLNFVDNCWSDFIKYRK